MQDAILSPAVQDQSAALIRGWFPRRVIGLHWSSVAATGSLFLVLVFCNVPGQEVWRPMHRTTGFRSWPQLEHGWPFTWANRPWAATLPGMPDIFIGKANLWTFWTDGPRFHWRSLGINVVTVVSVSLLGGAAFELWRRARAQIWQFHLRDMLGMVLLISLAGAWYLSRKARWEMQERIVANQASYTVSNPIVGVPPTVRNDHGILSCVKEPGGITWVRQLLGDKHFRFLDRVVEVSVDRDGLAWAAELPDVRAVHVLGNVTSTNLLHLQQLPKLELLEMEGSDTSPIALRTLSMGGNEFNTAKRGEPHLTIPPLPRLRFLYLVNMRCKTLGEFPALEVLGWSGSHVDEALLRQIAKQSNLRQLRLEDCALLGDGWSDLAALRALARLELNKTTIADAGFGQLAKLTQLRELKISGCPIDGGGLVHLAPLTQLESLDLSDTNVDDKAMVHLAAFKQLRSLNLTQTRVTRHGIHHLSQLKGLRSISLPLTSSSDAASVVQLQAALPDCQVHIAQ